MYEVVDRLDVHRAASTIHNLLSQDAILSVFGSMVSITHFAVRILLLESQEFVLRPNTMHTVVQ